MKYCAAGTSKLQISAFYYSTCDIISVLFPEMNQNNSFSGFRGWAAFTYAYVQKNILKIWLRVS